MNVKTILWIKKGIVSLVSPFTISILSLLAGFCLLLIHKRKTGFFFFGCGLLFLLFSGYGVLNGQLERIDSRYSPLQIEKIAPPDRAKIQNIVVLGSGHVSDPRLPPTSVINSDSLYRLVEGIRIMNALPGTKLVLSGGKGFDTVANATVMALVAKALNVPEEKIVTEPRPQDTAQEAKLLQPLLHTNPFVLVTSAVHMRRAMDLFAKQGMHPIPAPTDYIFRRNKRSPMDLLPSIRNAALTERLVYEHLGRLWAIITRQI